MDAFIGQRDRTRPAQALARCAYDGPAAFDPKIHCFTPVMSGDFATNDGATLANIGVPDKGADLTKMHISKRWAAAQAGE
jgi:hypothetical protein